MIKIVLMVMVSLSLFGDCKEHMVKAKSAQGNIDKFNKEGNVKMVAAYYAVKNGHLIQYQTCVMKQNHLELKELLRRVPKLDGNTDLKYNTDTKSETNYGTGY